MPRRNAPLRAGGTLNRDAVLTLMPGPLVAVLSRLLQGELEVLVDTANISLGNHLADDAAETLLERRADLAPTHRSALLSARRGQGVFRANVEQLQQGCRITGLLDRRHLRAVHIKPWAASSDLEKLDGHNGLLLSPHLAQLFERGYISFAGNGGLLISPELNCAVLRAWHVDERDTYGAFTREQQQYLEFHRREIFGRHGGGRRRQSATQFIESRTRAQPEPAIVEPAAIESA